MFKIKNILIKGILLLLFFQTGMVYAQDITFEASVDNNRVSLGSSIKLTLSFTGLSNARALQLPPMDDFQVQYLGPTRRITIVNGNYSKIVSHTYNLLPLKVGTFQIPSFHVEIDGKTYTSEPISIKVVDNSSDSSNGLNADVSTSQTVRLSDKISLVVETHKNQVYVSQPVPLTIKLYVNGLSISDIAYPVFDKKGLLVDEYGKVKQYQELKAGVRNNVFEFNTVVYPTQTGDLKIGPVQLTCNLVSQGQRRGSAFGGFDSFFDDFFNTVEKQPITVQSQAIGLKVLPFPEANKPKNFSDAVGEFHLSVSASPLEVNVGDPITIRMKVWGIGNLKMVKMPQFKDSEDFKVYEPQIKLEDGVKILEQVLIPKNEKIKAIPEVHFSYFDTDKGQYQTIVKKAIALTVHPAKQQSELKVFSSQDKTEIRTPEKIGEDIVYIKEKPGQFRSIDDVFYKSVMVKWIVAGITLFFIGGLLYYRRHNRVSTDLAYARRLKAPKQAKEGIKEAYQYLKRHKTKEFYVTIFKVIQHYFGNKFHLSSQGLTIKELEKIFDNKNIKQEMVSSVQQILEECDQVRFASTIKEEATMKKHLEQVESIIDYFERKVS